MPSTTLSVISCLMIRPRAAPSAPRTAISRSRLAARASSRFATFAVAMSSRQPTAPSSTYRIRRTSPTTASWSGTASSVQCSGAGYCRFRPAVTTSRFARSSAMRHARLEPRDGRQVERPATLRLLHRQDAPDLHVAPRMAEVGRHHADDGVRLRADRHRASDDRRVAVEAAHPERMAEHGRLRRAWFVVAVLEDAAEQRPGAEHVEESIGHLGTAPMRSGGPSPPVSVADAVVEDGNGVGGLVLRAPREEVGVRKHQPATVGSGDANVRQSIGVAEWKRVSAARRRRR